MPHDLRSEAAGLVVAGRHVPVRQLLGLGMTALAGVTLALGDMAGAPLAWTAIAAAATLFSLEQTAPVRRVLDTAGGLITSALVCLLLLGTGGAESVLQDIYVVILVYAAVVFGWRRLAIDIVVVGTAALVPGLVDRAGPTFYLDLVADLVVWSAVAVLAGVLERRAHVAVGRSRRLRAAVDDVEDAVAVVDAATLRFTYVNRSAAQRLGLAPGEIEGRQPWELASTLDETQFRKLLGRLDVGGPAVQRDHVSRRGESERVFAISTRLVSGDGGAPQLVAVARDVTRQRRRALVERERSAMVEAADVAMVGTDARGFVRSWNPAAAQLYGVEASQAQGRHIAELVGGPDDDPLAGRDEISIDGVLHWSTTHHGPTAPFQVELTAVPFSAPGREGLGVAVLARDSSEHRDAIRAARRRERRFRTLAEEVRGVVYRFELGPPLRLTFMSDRMTDLLGDEPGDLLGGPGITVDRMHPDDRPRFTPGHPDNPRETDGISTYRVRHLDGSWVWVEDHHRPELDADGRRIAVLGVAFDITARIHEEQSRQRAFEHERELARELERTVVAQQSFLRSVSHEMRTPLTAVRGFAGTLRRHWTELEPTTVEQLLERLDANVERLDGQLADLLELETGGEQLARGDLEPVDLQQLVTAAVATAREGGHEIVAVVPPVTVEADATRLRRALVALLHNAVRHTPAGTTVRIWVEESCDEVVLHVSDDGPGVDPAIADRVFEAFVQGADAAASPSPGAGVGLALVQRIARLHGGHAEYHPQRPAGSCFCLHLPRRVV